MVCKEDVLLWFKDLESYKRIDVLYDLLNMCVPFELRFLGSCVEEIGKHTYQELRGPAINANDVDKLSKEAALTQQGLLDEAVRHRVLIYLSLLSSKNYSVANWLYKNILRTDWLEDCIVKGNLKEENVQSEFLLLYVMALHHPAFTFGQKLYFSKILTQLIELRECKNRISPKPSVYGYPPGFGYPTVKTMMKRRRIVCTDVVRQVALCFHVLDFFKHNPPEVPIVPVKTSITIPCGDDTLHQQPPGLPHVPPLSQPPQEFVAWSIPGFPCGAPEVGIALGRPPAEPDVTRNALLQVPPPFPLPAVSPLVSEATSPNHSRSASPHRTAVALRPMGAAPRPPTIDAIQLPHEQLSSNNFPYLHPAGEGVKMPEEELNSIPEEKLMLEGPWLKQPNGVRFGGPKGGPSRPFCLEQFQALSVDGEPHSSSSSSPNQTPPETPAATPAAAKPRVNGMPFGPGPPLCDTTSPPPPTFNNVPYTTYPTTFTAIPTRSMFPYTQSYRPPFTHFPSYQAAAAANETSYPTYSLPYMSIIYSSPQFPPRNPNCHNCGALGHAGQDCTGQNIEDITQKKTYTIEFAPLPDTDK